MQRPRSYRYYALILFIIGIACVFFTSKFHASSRNNPYQIKSEHAHANAPNPYCAILNTTYQKDAYCQATKKSALNSSYQVHTPKFHQPQSHHIKQQRHTHNSSHQQKTTHQATKKIGLKWHYQAGSKKDYQPVNHQPQASSLTQYCAVLKTAGKTDARCNPVNPDQPVNTSDTNTFALSNQTLGLKGPLSFSTTYDEQYGTSFNAQYTQRFNQNNAYSILLSWGSGQNRENATWGHIFNPHNRLKISLERLSQRLQFDFDSGTITYSVPQYAGGFDYQYIINNPWINHIDVSGYYSQAVSKNLPTAYILNADRTMGRANERRIAGGQDLDIATTAGIHPWKSGRFDLGLHYDRLYYNRRYEADVEDAGVGFSVDWTQLLRPNLKLALQSQVLQTYHNYTANLSWLHRTSGGLGLELAFNYSRTDSMTDLPDDNQYTLGINYLLDQSPQDHYQIVSNNTISDLLDWVNTPAVEMPQVFAIADQKTGPELTIAQLNLTADQVSGSTVRLFWTLVAGDNLPDTNVVYQVTFFPVVTNSHALNGGKFSTVDCDAAKPSGYQAETTRANEFNENITDSSTYCAQVTAEDYSVTDRNGLPLTKTSSWIQVNGITWNAELHASDEDYYTAKLHWQPAYQQEEALTNYQVNFLSGQGNSTIIHNADGSYTADLTDLSADTNYQVSVTTTNKNNVEDTTAPISFKTATLPVITWTPGFNIYGITQDEAKIHWSLAQEDGNDITTDSQYQLVVNGQGIGRSSIICDSNGCDANLIGLISGQTYTVSVTVTDSTGNVTKTETTPSFQTVSEITWTPNFTDSHVTQTDATISWDEAREDGVTISDPDQYQFVINGNSQATVNITGCANNVCHADVSNLTSGTQYTAQVTVSDSRRSVSKTESHSFTTLSQLTWSDPEFSTSNKTPNAVTLHWRAAQQDGNAITDINQYAVTLASGGGQIGAGSCGSDNCQITISGLAPDTSYLVDLTVEDSQKKVSLSKQTTVETDPLPIVTWTPSFSTSDIAQTSIKIHWAVAKQDGINITNNSQYNMIINGASGASHSISCNASTCTASVSGLTANTTYTATATVTDSSGLVSNTKTTNSFSTLANAITLTCPDTVGTSGPNQTTFTADGVNFSLVGSNPPFLTNYISTVELINNRTVIRCSYTNGSDTVSFDSENLHSANFTTSGGTSCTANSHASNCRVNVVQ